MLINSNSLQPAVELRTTRQSSETAQSNNPMQQSMTGYYLDEITQSNDLLQKSRMY